MENPQTKNFLQKFFEAFAIKKEQENFGDIMQSIRDGVTFRGTNLWVLIFAILIASIGLNMNSTAVIIGAMLISPLMGPILGMGVSIAINDDFLLKRSLRNFTFAIIVSLVTSTLYFLISPISSAQSELLARTSPNIWDVLIAFFGGFAGVIAIASQKKWNVIPWVAIATALMPPLCTVGFGIANLRPDFIFGALYLFFINTVFIAVSAFLVGRFLKFPYKEFPDNNEKKRGIRMIAMVVTLTIIPSIYFAYDMLRQNAFALAANRFVESEANFPENYLLKKTIDSENRKIILIFGGKTITDEQIAKAKNQLKNYNIENADLSIRQGFASLYQNPEMPEKNSSYQAQIEQLSATLAEKEQEIEKILNEKNLQIANSQQIFKEMKTLFDGVENLILWENLKVENSWENQKMAIIFVAENFEKNSKTRISSWIKTRLQSENIEIIFHKNATEIAENNSENNIENEENNNF